jgi:hypothetical protein
MITMMKMMKMKTNKKGGGGDKYENDEWIDKKHRRWRKDYFREFSLFYEEL